VEPATYLPVLTAIGRILKNSYNESDLDVAGSGLIQIINKGESVPVKSKAGPARKLSDQYFKKISAIND
jgi:regulator of PEP synthase PpsR (kinase-PPPase family)